MSNTRVGRFGEILLHAAGLETAHLAAFLQELDGDEPSLAAEIHSRLSVSEALPDSFLARPALERLEPPKELPRRVHQLDTAPLDANRLRRGETGEQSRQSDPLEFQLTPVSDRYSLGRCLGEGGMARVFEAFDHKLSRPLALKFLTRDDPAVVLYLLHEARAQARVRHEHVLEVYDTGELDGKPFISMALVPGPTLGEMHGHTSLEQRARLLVQVAEGLHAAHCEGLIHRDVKPSNILVEETAEGGLKAFIADFGIASDPAAPASELAGTPMFMAPELLSQQRGPIDRRVDVYSLGVTMYELFAGRTPHAGDTPIQLVQSILHRDPPPPRHHLPSLPADLEAIILRSMARRPEDRYPSARAVALELRRFLAGEVVEAHAESLAYRLTRFGLRHKALVATVGVALLALLGASIAVAIFAFRADRERERAEGRRHQAEELIDFMVVDLRQKLASVERLEVLEEVDAAALDYFATVPAAELTDQELAVRSRTLYQIGETRYQRGDLAGAAVPFQESLKLARSLSEKNPANTERLFDLGQSYFWVGYVRFRQMNFSGARPPFEAYLDIARRLNQVDPDNRDWQLELSYASSNLGSVSQSLGDFETALELFRSSLAIDRRLVEENPDDPELRRALGSTHNTLGEVLQSLGRLREARGHFEADVALDRDLVAAAPAHHRARASLGTGLEFLGSLLYDLGDLAAAEASLREARSVSEYLVALDSENSIRRWELAWRRVELGKVARDRGDLALAREELHGAFDLLEAGLESHDSDHRWRRTLSAAHHHLATVAEDSSAARKHANAAIETLEVLLASLPEDRKTRLWLAKSQLLAGRIAKEGGEVETARELFERSRRTLAPFMPENRDGRWLAPWAEVQWNLGRPDELRRSLEILRDQDFFSPGLAAFARAPVGEPGADKVRP